MKVLKVQQIFSKIITENAFGGMVLNQVVTSVDLDEMNNPIRIIIID